MSLEAIAQQLASLISSDHTSAIEQEALSLVLVDRLFQCLALPDAPLEVRSAFGNPFDQGQPLLDWIDQHPLVHGLAPLVPIAGLLDGVSVAGMPLMVYVPKWFRIDASGRPLVFPPQLSLGEKQAGQTQLTSYQHYTLAPYLHPDLLQTLEHCEPRSSLLYSFTLFLTRTILDTMGKDHNQVLTALRRCRLHDRTLAPGLAELLLEILTKPIDQAPACSCRELAVQVQERLRTNPFLCRTSLNQATEHEVFAYSVFGLNKKEPANEDRVVCWNRGPISFALVADGVSTVDLGSGEQAAEEIVRLFRSRFQPRLETLASPASPADGARQFLREFFIAANVQVVAHVNRLFDPASGVVPQSPLWSTLTAVVVVHDQAWISFVGDSPALLYSRARGRLLQLSIEDHIGLVEEYDPESGIDPRALTQVIGQCRFVKESGRFEPEELNIPVVQVQLHPGDLLVIGSDGLLECIDEPTARARLRRVETELRRLHGVDHPLRLIVRALILLGEEGLSDDNISAAAVRIVGAEILDDEPSR